MAFVRIGPVTGFPNRRARMVQIDDEEIALWHVDGRFYAVANVCPHQHFSVLHQATLEGTVVTCPMHGWSYSLETGLAQNGNGRVKTYEVKIENGYVFVQCSIVPPSP